jgi:uncharacterized protein (TIGR01777 family)
VTSDPISSAPAVGSPRIVITGATGLIGSALVPTLTSRGYDVRRVTRSAHVTRAGDIRWDPDNGILDPAALEGATAIIHLAGEPVAARWTTERRRRIRESRVKGTRLLAETLARLRNRPAILISMSAVGYYGDRGDELLTEESSSGDDFLSEVGREWENAANPAREAGIRVVHPRMGIVLARRGGALGRMLPFFRFGLGGRLGNGRQWMSWIALTDVVTAMLHVIATPALAGAVNFVAPNPVRNAEFAKTLGEVLHRPAIIPAPAFALRIIFGEMARVTILASQRVQPQRLLASGFRFPHEHVDDALRHELAKKTGVRAVA